MELAVFNVIAPAIPLFHGFGRIGCLLAGCCYGKELNAPIEILHMIHVERFPVQAIESLFEFVLFVVMLFIDRKKNHTDLLKIYLLSYAVFRFVNEFFRGDEVRGIYMGLSTAQWISLAIVAYYVVAFMRNRCRKPLSPMSGL
jgi:phosphatidylglycerol:prolipoprotein diacylglycerol transferase